MKEKIDENKNSSEEIKEINLKANIKYSICTCGGSKNIPWCDNSHRILNEGKGTSYKSLKIIPKKDIILQISSSNWKKE